MRRFLSNLAFLILDEAHTYDGALGTHCLYLLHRLQQKRKELMAQFEPLRVIAASATIHNPALLLETLTGLPFQVVDDRYDGSPRAELTVQHVVGREPHDEGWRDLQAAVREVINDHPDQSYIAFVDDRQLAERSAAGIEAARSITEDAIIVESRDAMAYRSGLMRRERIEEALPAGDIRGLASTSAMEMASTSPICRWASTWDCSTRWGRSGSAPDGWDEPARAGSSWWRRATPSNSTRTASKTIGNSRWSRPGSIQPISTSRTPTAAAWPRRPTSTAWSAASHGTAYFLC